MALVLIFWATVLMGQALIVLDLLLILMLGANTGTFRSKKATEASLVFKLYVCFMKHHPTVPLTVLEPRDQGIGKFYIVLQICESVGRAFLTGNVRFFSTQNLSVLRALE